MSELLGRTSSITHSLYATNNRPSGTYRYSSSLAILMNGGDRLVHGGDVKRIKSNKKLAWG